MPTQEECAWLVGTLYPSNTCTPICKYMYLLKVENHMLICYIVYYYLKLLSTWLSPKG